VTVAAPSLALLSERPADLIVLVGLATLVPVALVTLTAFLKIVVVLSVLRQALGAPQIPPSTVVTGLALLLTFAVMAPVAEAALVAANAPVPAAGVAGSIERARRAAEPLREFLLRHARADDREAFAEIARRAGRDAAAGPRDFAVVAPAFVISELRRAFTIGFLVFLPFLVIDLVVANVLLALGLTQLSPTTVALPMKLLLFVAADGWRLVARGLALSYAG
jgi:type III secretion protein R